MKKSFNKWQRKSCLALLLLAMGTSGFASPVARPASTLVQPVAWTITGKVVTAQGESLPGVTVVVKGTSNGTATDADGAFSLNVPETAGTLVFSFIGYTSKEVPFTGAGNFNVTMLEDAKALEEVVVVGYGTQRKQDLTGAVTSISPKEFNKGVVATPDQLLVGKVAGLTINRNSGDPTGGATMQMRGPSSLTAGSAPFYVIDGVPGVSIDLVAPDDIVSIDVLKDASATAIYGSRAANGVIMVTTKRGKSGKPTLSYSGYAALESVSNRVEVLSAGEYRKFLADNSLAVAESEDGYSTDWQDQLFRKGISHNHNLSFTGGTDETKYNASLNYFKNDGIVKKNDIERVVARLGIDQTAFDGRVRLGLTATNSFIKSNHIDYGIFNGAARFLPVSPIMSDNPTYSRYGGYFQVPGRVNYNNPVAILNQRDETQARNIVLGTGKLGIDLLPGLVFDMTGSMQVEQWDKNYYMSRQDYSPSALGIGRAERQALKHTEKIFESYLTYSKLLGKHEVKVVGGYSYQNSIRNDGIRGNNTTFSSDDLGANNLAVGMGEGLLHFQDFPRKEMSTLVSFFSRVSYNFNEKYMFNATVRRDGSSRFGVNNRWATFPSFGLGWRLLEENFMKSQQLFSDLKLRVGYGVSGNQNIAPYRTLTQYGPQADQFLYNGEWINSYAVNQNPNPDLKWESTAMANIGLDFAFLKGRINGSVEYYDKRTEDLLYEYTVPTPPYQHNVLLANGGSMTNKGVEFMLSAQVLENSKLRWNTSANFAHNKNRIGSLSSNIGNLSVTERREGFIGLDGWTGQSVALVQPGLAIGTFYTAKYIGYDAEAKETLYQRPNGELVTADQLQTPGDYQVVGQALPKLTYGWSNNFNYDKFDFSFFLRGVYGNKIFNATRADLSRLTQATNTNISPYAVEDGVFEAPVASSRWLEDGSFLRLDNATLGYTFDVSKFKHFSNARVYVTGQNLFVLTNYTGVDPEVSLGGTTTERALAPGIDDRNYYPKTRSFIVGINLSF
jgi:TonB-linked SusC/RagA family outer membrane protein